MSDAMTAKEFEQLLFDKHIETACPACRRCDWRGVEDVTSLPIRGDGRSARYQAPGDASRRTVELVAPSCGNCGYVRMFDLHFLKGGD
jgi:hypothetical protein